MSIKKYISPVMGVVALVLSLGVSVTALAAPSFIQLGSSATAVVTADQVNKPQVANLDSQDHKVGNALSWDKATPNVVTINEDGAYFLMTVAQVGAHEGVNYKGADVYIWNTLNGKPMHETTAWVFASATARAKTIVSQDALMLKKGDKLGFMYTASSENGGLVTQQAPSGVPAAGALTVTIFKID